MLIIPIVAVFFIGGSYFLATRFLPGPIAVKAMPWMAAAALLGYVLTQLLIGVVLQLAGMPLASVSIALLIAASLLGALGGAVLVLHGFVRRRRRRIAEKEARSSVF